MPADKEDFSWSPLASKHASTLIKFDEELAEQMLEMDSDRLKQLVLQSERNLLGNERRRKMDRELEKAKRKVKERQEPYNEIKKFQTAKRELASLILEERGVVVSQDTGEDDE